MQLNELKKSTATKKPKRIGRGGKRGTFSGRGTKGQKARSGHRIRPQLRDEIKKLHKKRGFGIHRADSVRSDRQKYAVVNIKKIERAASEGAEITPKVLLEKKLITKGQGRRLSVKILGGSGIKKKLVISGCIVSESARKAIEAAGGTVK
ncbi:MAG: uL15 family ribosomal protein [Parcubacteria group bacterium]|nr:uL15 family ribosomal protein [Parcubacteria group bacterium]